MLPEQLYQQAVCGTSPELAAISTILLFLVIAIMVIARVAGKKARVA
jgi:ABC-type spermidine/putrescine transport system permease subunit II